MKRLIYGLALIIGVALAAPFLLIIAVFVVISHGSKRLLLLPLYPASFLQCQFIRIKDRIKNGKGKQ